jgi:glycolate oxidase FAD binding subunit
MTEHELPALSRLRDRVRTASGERSPLRIRAGGTKDFYGNATAGDLLDPREVRGIVDYAPTELVVTVRGGTPLAELEAALAEHNQMLPFEPPHFGPSATIGGAVVAGIAGPRRVAAGSIRDFVLGARMIDGRGDVLTFGGRVMKNVAGYDMGRVLAGSLGTLGVLVDVSLKVLPRPVAERTLRFDIDEAGAIRQLNEWGGQPLPITASAWCDNLLWLRLAGARAAVDAAQARLGGSVVDDAGRWWADLREQRHPYFSTDAQRALWRLSVPPTTPPLGLGATLIEWHGGQRWLSGEVDATALRARVATAGGHATRFRGGDARIPAFHALDPVLARLNARLKAEFDPAGIFNPGRLSPL